MLPFISFAKEEIPIPSIHIDVEFFGSIKNTIFRMWWWLFIHEVSIDLDRFSLAFYEIANNGENNALHLEIKKLANTQWELRDDLSLSDVSKAMNKYARDCSDYIRIEENQILKKGLFTSYETGDGPRHSEDSRWAKMLKKLMDAFYPLYIR